MHARTPRNRLRLSAEEFGEPPRKGARLLDRKHMCGTRQHVGLDCGQVFDQEILPLLPDDGDAGTAATEDRERRYADSPGFHCTEAPVAHRRQLLLEERRRIDNRLLQRLRHAASDGRAPVCARD